MSKVDGVGVAFCGGGFRSYAEVAVVEDLAREGITIGAIAGTSMGSLVAALVGAGLSPQRVAELLVELDHRVVETGTLKNLRLRVINMVTSNGIVESEKMQELARGVLGEAGIHTFGDFIMPVAMPAVDIVSGELTVFTNDPELFKSTGAGWTCISGDDLDVASCACASASYPLVIAPTTYRGHVYMDGGCRMNLPTPLFDRSSVDAVVGVGMIRQLEPLNDLKPLAIAQRTMSCGANQLDRLHAQAADIYVNLPVSGADAFQAGTGQQVIDEAREMLRANPVDWSPARPSAFSAMRRAAVDAIASMVRGWQSSQQNFQQNS